MTMPENPERLIARVHADGSGMVCVYAVPQYNEAPSQGEWVAYEPSKPQTYVREDKHKAAVEAAVREGAEAALRGVSNRVKECFNGAKDKAEAHDTTKRGAIAATAQMDAFDHIVDVIEEAIKAQKGQAK